MLRRHLYGMLVALGMLSTAQPAFAGNWFCDWILDVCRHPPAPAPNFTIGIPCDGEFAPDMADRTPVDGTIMLFTEPDYKGHCVLFSEAPWSDHFFPDLRQQAMDNRIRSIRSRLSPSTNGQFFLAEHPNWGGQTLQIAGHIDIPNLWDYVKGGPCWVVAGCFQPTSMALFF
jgi:hypothetical protein